LPIEYQTIVVASIVIQVEILKSNRGVFDTIGHKSGTRDKLEVFNLKAIPEGFSSTGSIGHGFHSRGSKILYLIKIFSAQTFN